MRKIKLLHLISGLAIGGAEKVVLDLARMLDPTKFETHVVVIGSNIDMLPKFEKEGISITVLYASKSPISLCQAMKKVDQIIRKHSIELIHAHMFHAMVCAGWLRLFNRKIKVVFTAHNFDLGSKNRVRLLKWMTSFREVDILFSSDMKMKFNHENTRVIPNGIEFEAFQLELPKFEQFTFLAIGSLTKQKNLMHLIDVVSNMKTNLSFRLLIAGDGIQRPFLEQAIKEKKIEGRVKLLGLRNDIPQLCNQVHALLMPSLWEGFPLVLLEAGAAGLPVITTPVGAIPSLINNENGYLSNLENFKDRMMEIMSDYGLAEQKGNLLQKKVREEFDLSIIIRQHADLYQCVIEETEKTRMNKNKNAIS